MELYKKSIYDVQRYIQWPHIKFEDEHLVSFPFFQELEDIYERVKAEVQAKEVISKEYIQQLLINLDGVFTLYIFRAQVCDRHGKVQRV